MLIKMNREEAASVLRADSVATGETTTAAVSDSVIGQIVEEWPGLRAEYQVNPPGPPGCYWKRTEEFSGMATHEWAFCEEEFLPGEDDPRRKLYAAPEIYGVPPGEPFATVSPTMTC